MKRVLNSKQRAYCSRRATELLQELRPCWVAYVSRLVEREACKTPVDDAAVLAELAVATATDALFFYMPILRQALSGGPPPLAIRRGLRQAMNRAAYGVETSLAAAMRLYVVECVEAAQEFASFLSDQEVERVVRGITPAQVLGAADQICDLIEAANGNKAEPKYA